MSFIQLKAQEGICRALQSMVDSDKVAHAIMFEEEDGGGAVELALVFLKYLYCKNRQEGQACGKCPSCNKISKLIHPDMHFVFPVNSGLCSEYLDKWRALLLSNPHFGENELSEALQIEGKSAMIKVDEAKALLDKLSFSALERGYRSVLIYLPEKMNKDAANRLLKLVEEPPLKTIFIFITHSPELVLPTIASRCQIFRLKAQRQRSVGGAAEMELLRPLMQALLARDLYACLDISDNLANLPSKEKAKNFCKFAAEQMRNVFLLQQGMDSLVEEGDVQEYRDWAQRSSKTFPRKALEAFGRAQMLIGRNVNVKILFTDLVNTLYNVI